MGVPCHPFQGGQFDGFSRFPGTASGDRLGLVEAVDGFYKGGIMAIAQAANGRFYAGPLLSQPPVSGYLSFNERECRSNHE